MQTVIDTLSLEDILHIMHHGKNARSEAYDRRVLGDAAMTDAVRDIVATSIDRMADSGDFCEILDASEAITRDSVYVQRTARFLGSDIILAVEFSRILPGFFLLKVAGGHMVDGEPVAVRTESLHIMDACEGYAVRVRESMAEPENIDHAILEMLYSCMVAAQSAK